MLKKGFFLIFFLCNQLIAHEQDLLKSSDISKIMEQILGEHVDKREVSSKVFAQALENFVNQFDPYRIYLLENEVKPYFNPSQQRLGEMLEQYKKGDFSSFTQLNQLIQESIMRSRKMRESLDESSKQNLFQNTQPMDRLTHQFAKTKTELAERILQNIRSYIAFEKKRFGDVMTPQRKEQILTSYEGRLRNNENQYLYQNEKGELLPKNEQENLFALHVLKALAGSLDSHTTFYKKNEAFDIRVRLQKEFKGIGLVLKDTSQGAIVSHLLDGGPAAKSQKIKTGDILLSIDGLSVDDLPFDKIMDLLRGEKNSAVKLTFKRPASKGEPSSQYTVELTREMIILKNDRVDVRTEAFGNGEIGVIALHSFYQGEGVSSVDDVKKAVEDLEKKGNLKGLILDLRDNGGGFLSQAVKVAGLFITDGVIVVSKYSNGEERIYRDVDGNTLYDGPLIVLTSKATASAAEIVAQALQDYGVALVVGDEHTYGKGTIQTQTITDNQSSSYFKVTVGEYFTVSGRTPQKEGVKSDIVAPGHWNSEEIGEMYADTLSGGVIPPLYNDTLKDVPPQLRNWYIKYYIPKLQKKTSLWRDLLPTLRKNSEYRIAHNKNYQYFLKGTISEDDSEDEEEWNSSDKKNKSYGEDDLQVQEAINILKDMIILHSLTKK